MKTIFKYELELVEFNQNIPMPFDSNVLSVQMQNDKLVIWALVNTETEYTDRIFKIFPTGNKFDTESYRYKFIGTFQAGWFVGHLFELFI